MIFTGVTPTAAHLMVWFLLCEFCGHKRAHWRRGHYKRRATGIFWWDAHIAGKAPGAVIHDYET